MNLLKYQFIQILKEKQNYNSLLENKHKNIFLKEKPKQQFILKVFPIILKLYVLIQLNLLIILANHSLNKKKSLWEYLEWVKNYYL